MKKNILLSIFALLTLVPQNSQAQLKFGVKGGVNITEMSLSSDILKADNRAGFFIGPSLRLKTHTFISFDLAALYNEKSFKLGTNFVEENIPSGSMSTETGFDIAQTSAKQRSVDVPLNIRASLGPVYVAAGPQLSFNVGDDIDLGSSSWYKRTFRPKDSAFSINLGAGLSFGPVEVGVTYNIACGNTGDVTFQDVKDQVKEEVKALDTKYNAWQISAAIYF